MKTDGVSIVPPFLTSVVDGNQWTVSQPGRFTSGKTALGTHCIEFWVYTTVGIDRLDAVEKRKSPLPGTEP